MWIGALEQCPWQNCSSCTGCDGVFVGEFHETVRHYSSYSGVDDSCSSIPHQSCSRLGLGLAWWRLGLGRRRCRPSRRSVNRWRDRRVILRLRLPGLWLRLQLSGLWLWLRHRLQLSGLWGLQSCLSPRCATPYLCDCCRCPSLSSFALMRDALAH